MSLPHDASSDSTKETPKGRFAWPDSVPVKEYTGGCHCRSFTYTFEHPILDSEKVKVVSCNCSICTMKGLLNVYTPQSRFKLTKGSLDEMLSYTFNTRVGLHYSCRNCGVGILATIPTIAIVNVRTVDDIDLDRLTLKKVDGKNLL